MLVKNQLVEKMTQSIQNVKSSILPSSILFAYVQKLHLLDKVACIAATEKDLSNMLAIQIEIHYEPP